MSDATHNPLLDALEQLLAGEAPPARIRAIERGASAAELWHAIESAGYADAPRQEQNGGAGLSLAAAVELFESCGRHALPVPLAFTMLARAVLDAEAHAVPRGSITVAQALLQDDSLVCPNTPYGRSADWVVAVLPERAYLLSAEHASATPDGIFASLQAALRWPVAQLGAPLAPRDWCCAAAAVLAAQLSGTLARVVQLCIDYANTRQQFGRPIGKFQVIQHQVSVMAEELAAARMAARIGLGGAGLVVTPERGAVAKARCAEAARRVAALSHALHGAIGITSEYDLQLYTRRLHEWRLCFGAEAYWNQRLGAALLGAPDDNLVDWLRSGLHATPAD
jgi:alkylation response protein AidB-like acyl-CoA dehydrogenase